VKTVRRFLWFPLAACVLYVSVLTPAHAQSANPPAVPSVSQFAHVATGQVTTRQAAPATVAPGVQIAYTQFTLPNGLHVILHEDHTVPMVSVNMWYHVGSAREKPGRTGFAHLFEHLMFEGSAHVKAGEFDTLLEAVGGENNGST
jgi:hypothetical protein